jgi:Subtilase family
MRGISRAGGAAHGPARARAAGLVGTGICAALALASVPAAAAIRSPAAPAALAGPAAAGAAVPVIVFLKNQPGGAGGARDRSGQRLALLQAAQAPYLSQLAQLGASDVHKYALVDAIAARIPSSAVATLAGNPGVAAVIPDSPIVGPTAAADTPAADVPAAATPDTPAAVVKTPAGACSATPQLAPDALTLTHTDSSTAGAVTARSLGFTGAGVKVAFLADGIDPGNGNLQRGGKSVIGRYADFTGDGTAAPTEGGEAFIDANAIAGQGRPVYNVAGFGAQTPGSACNIRIQGVAPGASLVALKVFSNNDISTTSAFLQAIDYAVDTEHVNVLNESFGANPFPDVSSLDAVKEFNNRAVAAGVTVVVAAGDAGPFSTIGSPASDPNVISVGASTDFRFYAQTDYAGADKFAPGGWLNNNISALSSGGYTQAGRTLDLVAPGDLSFASCTPDPAEYADCVNFLGKASPVEETGGTSESAPEVAGAAALVIQAYRKAHGNATPTPAQVKQILLSTASDLGAPATEQGSGLLNSLKAVELASFMSHCDPVGETLRLSSNQLNYVGKPGATAHWSVTVTNTGVKTQQVSVAGRGFTGDSVVKQATVTLSDSRSAHFTSWTGAAANYGAVRFTVPANQAVLNGSIAWPSTAAAASHPNKRVRLVLVDPSGRLAAHSLPQGAGGYGSAQVLHPAAGTWTAEIFSDASTAGGTTGAVRFGATVARTSSFGSVSPSSLTLKPGASTTVRVSAVVPAGAGDSSGTVEFGTGPAGGGPVSVPVTLRGRVDAGLGTSGRFSGVLTGGNGRSPGEGQVESYSFAVPSGLPVMLRDLEVNVVLGNDPENQVSAYLVAPGGQTMGYGSNYLATGFTGAGVPVESPRRQLSLYTSNPTAGIWTLIIDFTSPVPGNELKDPFTGLIRFNGVRWSRGGLPGGPRATLKAGKSYSYQIRLDNTGAAPEDFFLDARRRGLASYALAPQDAVKGLKLPLAASADPPEWIVPTMTHSVSATATTSKGRVMFDFGPFPGDPDEESSSGASATAGFPLGRATTPVTQGLWFAVPSEVGPFGAGKAAAATAAMTMRATTEAFDPTVTSAEGDFWKFGVTSLAKSASYNLFTVNPGQTKTLTLTIKPSGKAGTVVQGIVYVDDFVDSLQFLSGSQLVAIPYEYKIG